MVRLATLAALFGVTAPWPMAAVAQESNETPAAVAPKASSPGPSMAAPSPSTDTGAVRADRPRARQLNIFAPVMAPGIARGISVQPPDQQLAATPATQPTAQTAASVATLEDATDQLDKFQKVYLDATKIFGDEHLVISPSFYLARDIGGRLDSTNKVQAGLSGTLLLPLIGAGGGPGVDWWPVVTTEQASDVYQTFLDQLAQYQNVLANLPQVPAELKAIAQTKWTAQTLLAAKQIFCADDVDWPADAKDAIKRLCDGDLSVVAAPSPSDQAAKADTDQRDRQWRIGRQVRRSQVQGRVRIGVVRRPGNLGRARR